MSETTSPRDSLAIMLRELKLPAFEQHAEEIAQLAEREGWTFMRFLHHLAELELQERRRRRIARHLKQADLPPDKTLATLKAAWLPTKVAKKLATLCEGGFVDRGDNLLAFGLPGRGKTHLVSAIGHELVHRGYRVLFTPTYALVQRLLAAKRDLRLEKELAILDGFDAVILDDIGYVQQSREEMEVLFTFLAERYERRTVMITSNLVFSEWDRIFKDPMTTAAAIDRLVHHSVILEMTGPSIRTEQAQAEHGKKGGRARTTTTTTPNADANDNYEGATATTTSPTSPETTTTPAMKPTSEDSPTTTIVTANPTAANQENEPTTTTPTAPTATTTPGQTTNRRAKHRDHATTTTTTDGEM
jgi:DNA replication protein DnaC